MDKIETYRQAVQTVLRKYSTYKPINVEIEVQAIFDTERDHYEVVSIGWQNDRRIHSCSMHIDIKPDNKVWIQVNNTEAMLADELMDLEVRREDIVLGFHTSYMRQFTGFAVG